MGGFLVTRGIENTGLQKMKPKTKLWRVARFAGFYNINLASRRSKDRVWMSLTSFFAVAGSLLVLDILGPSQSLIRSFLLNLTLLPSLHKS